MGPDAAPGISPRRSPTRWRPRRDDQVTGRLYHRDAYQRDCESTVAAVRLARERGRAIALAETVFYPASGGQPADQGCLGDVDVIDVQEEGGMIWHLVRADPAAPQAEPSLPPVGARLKGVIDWERRFDHMQQHTGQHILSQAFLQVANAQTISVHMERTCTIDLAAPALNEEQLARVERLANGVVAENRPVVIREIDPGEAEALGLRRPPKQTGRLRIVEVDGFDRSACGGTHVRACAEVGPIVIRGWERYKGGARVEFLCGWRVWRDYHRARTLLRDLAGRLTTGEDDLPASVTRLQEQVRLLERGLAEARAGLLEHEADRLIAEARAARPSAAPASGGAGGPLVVARVGEWGANEMRVLARALTVRAACVAVLAVEPERRLLVARSAGIELNATSVLAEALSAFGGRGGGKPEAAEGAAPSAPSAAALVDAARQAAGRALHPKG
jgi:alanyl-tRNA synthetase